MSGTRIETGRLTLRSWREDDLAPLQAICSDPRVMATIGPLQTSDQTAALMARLASQEAEHGHTFWALERTSDSRLIGWCGVIRADMAPIEGKAEIGWRLASDCWGYGFATEAARATVGWLFAQRRDDGAWAITATGNLRSRAVMERLGMTYHPDLDFDHPRIAEGDPLRGHVTYSISREVWGRK